MIRASACFAAIVFATTVRTLVADDVSNYWGAIAYSQSTGKWGYSRTWLSEVNARRVAIENCEAKDAKVVLAVGNYWCALALGDDVTAYGTGYAETADEAKRFALEECAKRTANSKIVVCFNTRDDDL
jgi:hypothetical protein